MQRKRDFLAKLVRRLELALLWFQDMTRIEKRCLVRGTIARLSISSRREYERAVSYTIKEPATLTWIEEYLHAGDVLYDIGANIGQYSLYAALKHGRKLRVYSFEPESQNFSALNRNIYLNELSSCITPFCLAVTDRTRIDSFHIQGRFRAGEALHQFGSLVDDSGRPFVPVHTQGMIGVSLDDLCFIYGLEIPNHLKIDVDGLEDNVLSGGSRMLKNNRVRSILVEVTEAEGRASSVYETLEEAGFRLAQTVPVRAGSVQHKSENALFLR